MASVVLSTRESKARDLVQAHLSDRAAGIIRGRVNATGVNTWLVKGSHGATYVVTLEPLATCDCPDHVRRGGECKHIQAVRLLAGPPPAPSLADARAARDAAIDARIEAQRRERLARRRSRDYREECDL